MRLTTVSRESQLNSDKQPRGRNTAGNALLYILLALGLLGLLTMTLRNQSDQAGGENLEKEQAQLYATKMVAYAAAVKNVVDQMTMSGTPPSKIITLNPKDIGFDTPPHIDKVFHPDGGGLSYQGASTPPFQGIDTPVAPGGWYLGRFNNIEWTPTTAPDIILTAFRIDRPVCELINRQITGSTDIPAIGGTGDMWTYLVNDFYHGAGNADLTQVVCPECEGYPALCVSNAAADNYSYYNIISGQ